MKCFISSVVHYRFQTDLKFVEVVTSWSAIESLLNRHYKFDIMFLFGWLNIYVYMFI